MRNIATWMMTILASVVPVLAHATSQHMVSTTRVNAIPSRMQFAVRLPRTDLPLPGLSTLVPHSGLFRILGETVARPGIANAVLQAGRDDRDQPLPVAPNPRNQVSPQPVAATSDPQVRPVGIRRIEYRGKSRHKPRNKHRFHWRPLATTHARSTT